jgi:membrane associated rhomboid family serine protease
MSVYDRDYMQPSRPSWNLRGVQWNAFRIVFWLNIAVFICQYLFGLGMDSSGGQLMPKGGVSLDLLTDGHVLSLLTYMFVHGDLGHVIVNLVMLWFVGKQVYQIFGGAHFLRIYLFGGLVGAALEIAMRAWFSDAPVYLVGASASIFALFLALAVTIPNEVFTALIYFIIPVRVRMWKLAAVVLGLNVVLGLLGLIWSGMPGSSTAYFAHIGGALTGWYYIRMLGFGDHPLTYRQLWNSTPRSPTSSAPPPHPHLVTPRRRRLGIDLEVDVAAARKRNPSGDPKVDVIREEVDPILDKISAHGLQSLSEEERLTLERASRLVSKNNKKPF